MKIAFFVGQFPTLSETFIINQICGLLDRGHDVQIYSRSHGNLEKMHEAVKKYNLMDRVHYPPKIPFNKFLRVLKALAIAATTLKGILTLIKALNIKRYGRIAASLDLFYFAAIFVKKSEKYDIIHCHFGPNGLRALYLKELGSIDGKLTTIFHGGEISKAVPGRDDKMYRPLFANDVAILPISMHWKEKLVKLGCPENKIKIHHMGVDTKMFEFCPRQLKASQWPRFLSVCRLTEKKGMAYAIRAISQLVKEGVDLEYNIIGTGELFEDLKKLIDELEVNGAVHLLGAMNHNQVHAFIRESHVFLAPSITSSTGDQEGIPVSIMEAMATGMPTISTRHTGIPELIEDGDSGFLVREKDINDLACCLRRVLNERDNWQNIGISARRKIEHEFDIDCLNNRLVDIFEKMLK